MSTIQSDIASTDQFAALPKRCRTGGGRNHEPYWSLEAESRRRLDYSGASFAPKSVPPRTIVTFGRKRLTFSYVSAKTRTGQQGEGPWEFLLAKHLEANPLIDDYQLHGLEGTISVAGEPLRLYGPDATWRDVAGQVTCGEVKASEGYFSLPEEHALHDVAAAGLAGIGVRFARVTGDALQEDRRRGFNVSRAFADRMTGLSGRQIEVTRETLAKGPVALGRLAEALGVSRAAAVQTVNALMVRRHAAYDLSAPVTPDLPIAAAPVAARKRDIRTLGA